MRFGYTAILDRLAEERAERDKRDANDALQFFDGDLSRDKRFMWKNQGAGKYRVMEKTERIAAVWRTILDTDAAIAAKWEKIRTQEVPNDGPAV